MEEGSSAKLKGRRKVGRNDSSAKSKEGITDVGGGGQRSGIHEASPQVLPPEQGFGRGRSLIELKGDNRKEGGVV